MSKKEIKEYFASNIEAKRELENFSQKKISILINQYENALLNLELKKIYIQEARIY